VLAGRRPADEEQGRNRRRRVGQALARNRQAQKQPGKGAAFRQNMLWGRVKRTLKKSKKNRQAERVFHSHLLNINYHVSQFLSMAM